MIKIKKIFSKLLVLFIFLILNNQINSETEHIIYIKAAIQNKKILHDLSFKIYENLRDNVIGGRENITYLMRREKNNPTISSTFSFYKQSDIKEESQTQQVRNRSNTRDELLDITFFENPQNIDLYNSIFKEKICEYILQNKNISIVIFGNPNNLIKESIDPLLKSSLSNKLRSSLIKIIYLVPPKINNKYTKNLMYPEDIQNKQETEDNIESFGKIATEDEEAEIEALLNIKKAFSCINISKGTEDFLKEKKNEINISDIINNIKKEPVRKAFKKWKKREATITNDDLLEPIIKQITKITEININKF